MRNNLITLFVCALSFNVVAAECSLYSNQTQISKQNDLFHISKSEGSPVVITSKEFRDVCLKKDYCHTGNAIYTKYVKELGSGTTKEVNLEAIEFIGNSYETSKNNETFVDVYSVDNQLMISNDVMYCGKADPILYVKLPVLDARMLIIQEVMKPNGIFSRDSVSQFEKLVIQDI